MPGIGVFDVFEAALPLKYAEHMGLYSPLDSPTGNNAEALMRYFVGVKSLQLHVAYAIFNQFNWAFLGQQPTRELRLIKVYAGFISNPPEPLYRSVEELVRYCTTLPRLLG